MAIRAGKHSGPSSSFKLLSEVTVRRATTWPTSTSQYDIFFTAKSSATLLMAGVSFRVPFICTFECAGPPPVFAGGETSASFLTCDLRVLLIGGGAEAVTIAFAPFAAAPAGRLRIGVRLPVEATSAVPGADSFHLGRGRPTCVRLRPRRAPQGLSLASPRPWPAGRARA